MRLKKYKQFNEIIKSDIYLKKTSTPYTDGGVSPESRFMEYDSEKFKEGWVLKSMQRVDFNGRKIGKEVPIKTFTNNFNTSFETIKTSITAALGEMARLPWIDNIKTQYGKLFTSIYLGKFGLEFKGELYSPVFELPEEGGKSGDTFWLVGTTPKTSKRFNRNSDNELEARTVMILNSDMTNDEIERVALHAIYQPIYRAWHKKILLDIQQGINSHKERPIIDPAYFKSAYQLIRDTGKKNFFIIFKSGFSEKDIVNSAKRGVRGYGDLEKSVVFRGKPIADDKEKEKRSMGKYFNLDADSMDMRTFQYFNKDKENHNVDFEKFTPLSVLKLNRMDPISGIRYIEVKNLKNQKTFVLKLKPGDIIKIPIKYGTSIKYNKSEVTQTNTSSTKNNSRVPIRPIE